MRNITIDQANEIVSKANEITRKFEKITVELDSLFAVLHSKSSMEDQSLYFSKNLHDYIIIQGNCLRHHCKSLSETIDSIKEIANPEGESFLKQNTSE